MKTNRVFHCFGVFGALLLVWLTAGGCGYHMGSMMHPQVKSIAVAPVVNDTVAFNVSAMLRGQLAEQFQVDGSLKVADLETADCIIYCKVTSVATSQVSGYSAAQNTAVFRPNEYQMHVTIEFSVVIPGSGKLLVPRRVITGRSNFQVRTDEEEARIRATKYACFQAARQIVVAVTEGW
ncbi:MAG: LPS assembly lipoprotein LptE [Victivallaceae bacterium]|nr:LPS assembly lipoprotein LptE [Victivallaceae bacterium]